VTLSTLVGQTRTSPWFTVSQDEVTAFGELTGDRNPLHLDPAWCAAQLAADAGGLDLPPGIVALNYGFDRLRLVAPVPVGSRIRGVFTVTATEPRGDGQTLLRQNVEVEIEGTQRPALVAEWLSMLVASAA
jgi:acyl dehydratase